MSRQALHFRLRYPSFTSNSHLDHTTPLVHPAVISKEDMGYSLGFRMAWGLRLDNEIIPQSSGFCQGAGLTS